MEFAVWEPVYRAICRDFGYDVAMDRRARDALGGLLSGHDPDAVPLPSLTGETVAIAGGAPSLEADLRMVEAADRTIAASGAAARLVDAGRTVAVAVTDLDGTPRRTVAMTQSATPVAIHAHGDNRDALARWVPRCEAAFVFPTTQAEPTDQVRNVGGFTDGDRAAFLADHLGAARLVFPGWDFDDPTVSARKRRKLLWAERLLFWLEGLRDERFAILDGRRTAIDTSPLPVNGSTPD